jgi:hypothetical protein
MICFKLKSTIKLYLQEIKMKIVQVGNLFIVENYKHSKRGQLIKAGFKWDDEIKKFFTNDIEKAKLIGCDIVICLA